MSIVGLSHQRRVWRARKGKGLPVLKCAPNRTHAVASHLVKNAKARGIVLAYDEAQCLNDRADSNEFPMSMLIETIASLQRKTGTTQYLLVLCGLPQAQDARTEARTYTERMFNVITLKRLSRADNS